MFPEKILFRKRNVDQVDLSGKLFLVVEERLNFVQGLCPVRTVPANRLNRHCTKVFREAARYRQTQRKSSACLPRPEALI